MLRLYSIIRVCVLAAAATGVDSTGTELRLRRSVSKQPPQHKVTFVLQTERLSLRRLTMDDLDFVFSMLSDPEVMRHYPQCYTREESVGWIERNLQRYASDGCGLWLVEDRETGRPVGQVGLVRRQLEGMQLLEVGYLIARPEWRRGFASEAAAGCRDHAFFVFGAEQVFALIRPENLPSRGVAAKIGMCPGRVVEHAGLPHILYSVSRTKRPQNG